MIAIGFAFDENYWVVIALVSVYNHFAQLMNDLERNNMKFPTVTINTKFLNSLQPEWLKYVTQVRITKQLTVDSFDDLFYYLQQFEKLVNASKAKKLEKSHDPLALVAHTGLSSRQRSSYYVTHPTSVVDYDDEYQQDDVHNNSEDPLVSAMLLLEKAITQNFSNPTNNRLHASFNTRNQAIIQGDRWNISKRILRTGNVQGLFDSSSAILQSVQMLQCYSRRRTYMLWTVQSQGLVTRCLFMVEILLAKGRACEFLLVKVYVASSLGNLEIPLNVRDSEDTLEDAFKSQQKLTEKMNDPIAVANKQNYWTINYKKLNALYKDFVPQKELSVEQKYFPSSSIPSVKIWMEILKNENVSLEFKVQSLTKERDNVKIEYQKLFNSIKKTRSQTQKEMDELIVYVFEKTYAYGAIRAENQNLLSTISELKTRLETVEKDNSKKAAKNVAVYVRKNKQTDNTFANVISNKENVNDVDVANASKAKTLLCVSCMQNVLIPCHDKCLAKLKLNVHSNVRRTFFTNSRTSKSLETTFVAPKTRFSEKETQSKTLDTTSVVSKSKIDVESASKAKDKVSSASRIKQRNLRDKPLNTFIKNKIRTSRIWQKWFESQPNVIWTPASVKPNVQNTRSFKKPSVLVKKWEVKLPSCPCVISSYVAVMVIARRQSHLNFGTINDLTRLDLVDGLPKFKYGKDHLCSAYERGKSNKASHPPKLVPSDHTEKLEITHIDLYSPEDGASINGKNFKIRTDNGTEFKNATLKAHYEKLGIMQQFSIARTPQQNGVVERRNRTLVEAARTMLIFSKLPEFLWAEAVATACFTQNRSIIHTRYNKTPYELLRGIRIITDDPKMIMETIHVKFDELTAMASEHDCLEPELQRFNYHNSSANSMNTPSKEDLDNLFGPMFEDYFEKASSDTTINSAAQPTQVHEESSSTSSIFVDTHEAPPVVTTSDEQTSPISLTESDEFNQEDSAAFDGNTQFVLYNPLSNEEIESSSTALEPSNVQNFHQVQPSTHIWTKDHPLDQVIGDPSKPIMTRQWL
ncbi:retrovirus-related pol polyprotein from transposon TNT 1-94 [Tanacetum coccineum]